jgi:hypothetical protein
MADPSYEDWLDEHPDNRDLVQAIEKNTGPLTSEFKAYLINQSRRTVQQFMATRDWLERLRRLCHRIAAGVASDSEYVLFWIYLHGVVHELYEKEDASREATMMIPWRRPFVEALDVLRVCFDEAELSFIRFMRHNHVHVLVDYPWQRLKAKDGVVTSIREAVNPEALANAERILSRYDGDQQAAARDFMAKAIRAVDRVNDAFTEATVI